MYSPPVVCPAGRCVKHRSFTQGTQASPVEDPWHARGAGKYFTLYPDRITGSIGGIYYTRRMPVPLVPGRCRPMRDFITITGGHCVSFIGVAAVAGLMAT